MLDKTVGYTPLDDPVRAPAIQPRPDALAIVIGNSAYHPAPDVAYAGNDAAAMKQVFTEALGIPADQVLVFTDISSVAMGRLFGEPGRPNGQIHRWAEGVGAKEIFVYYSGHGVPRLSGGGAEGYLLPVDVPADDPRFGYALKDLVAQLSATRARKVTLILDACFSGKTGSGAAMLPGTSGTFGVAVETPPAEVAILSATGPEQTAVAYWHEERKLGALTAFLIDGLRGAADAAGNRDGVLTLAEAYAYARKKTALHAAGRGATQTPTLRGPDLHRPLSRVAN